MNEAHKFSAIIQEALETYKIMLQDMIESLEGCKGHEQDVASAKEKSALIEEYLNKE